jgi:hypothetical protein
VLPSCTPLEGSISHRRPTGVSSRIATRNAGRRPESKISGSPIAIERAIPLLSDYHVFVTEHDDHQHLIVRDRMMTGFAVEADADIAELKGKTVQDVSGTFSWRVVAKRKDITAERLATVTIPPEPTLPPPVPDVSAPTPPPRRVHP